MKIYIVMHCPYDKSDFEFIESVHKTEKGALKHLINNDYEIREFELED